MPPLWQRIAEGQRLLQDCDAALDNAWEHTSAERSAVAKARRGFPNGILTSSFLVDDHDGLEENGYVGHASFGHDRNIRPGDRRSASPIGRGSAMVTGPHSDSFSEEEAAPPMALVATPHPPGVQVSSGDVSRRDPASPDSSRSYRDHQCGPTHPTSIEVSTEAAEEPGRPGGVFGVPDSSVSVDGTWSRLGSNLPSSNWTREAEENRCLAAYRQWQEDTAALASLQQRREALRRLHHGQQQSRRRPVATVSDCLCHLLAALSFVVYSVVFCAGARIHDAQDPTAVQTAGLEDTARDLESREAKLQDLIARHRIVEKERFRFTRGARARQPPRTGPSPLVGDVNRVEFSEDEQLEAGNIDVLNRPKIVTAADERLHDQYGQAAQQPQGEVAATENRDLAEKLDMMEKILSVDRARCRIALAHSGYDVREAIRFAFVAPEELDNLLVVDRKTTVQSEHTGAGDSALQAQRESKQRREARQVKSRERHKDQDQARRRREGEWQQQRRDLSAYYFNLATTFEDDGLLDLALEAYSESVGYVQAYPEAHYNRAILLDRLGRFEESVAASAEATRLRPNWVRLLVHAPLPSLSPPHVCC